MSDTDQPVTSKSVVKRLQAQGAEPVVAERCVACIANSTEVAIDLKHTYENGCELAMAEPVATLPACLCGLDTNPVASPRMDIHCPKHDAPEAVGEPSDEEFNPWYENYEKEVARALVDDWTNYVGLTEDEALDGNTVDALVDDIATALARRARTPTTDARERASITLFGFDYDEVWFRNRLGNEVVNELLHRIAALSSTPSVDDYVAWCRYVNHGTDDSGADILTIEICDSDAKDAFKVYRSTSSEQSCKQCGCTHATAYELGRQDERSATPTNEVAQRAWVVAAAEEIANWMNWKKNIVEAAHLQNIVSLTQMLSKHFTATDVEQGTCTWTCEPDPDIEMWETDCGNAFQFEVGGPAENKMKFCCYCGKRLVGKTAEG